MDFDKYSWSTREETEQVKQLFKADLIKEMEWGDLHKELQDELFRQAWDKGHAHGFHEIYSEALDLDEIVTLFRYIYFD